MIIKNNSVKEELFVPLARYLRYRKVIPLLTKNKQISIVDFGCDPEFSFYAYCKKNEVKIDKYLGIDPLLDNTLMKKFKNNNVVTLVKSYIPVSNESKPKSNQYDFAISLALLEHLEKPGLLIEEAVRVLKKGGKFIFTTPTPFAEPILEFLSFKLHLLSPESIADHKNYFNRRSLSVLLSEFENVEYEHKYFDFGVNNLVVMTKL